MRIISIEIDKLYGNYNYSVFFDEKLTFLYGENGCGKTTILNILSSIITGKFYDLVSYTFSAITLRYEFHSQISSIEIHIDDINKFSRNMKISYDNRYYEIKDVDNLFESLIRRSEDDDIENEFFHLYPFAEKIKTRFNYIFLPLSRYRDRSYNLNTDFFGYIDRYRYSARKSDKSIYLNESLKHIEELIYKKNTEINVNLNQINDEFRRKVLTTIMCVNSGIPIMEIIEKIDTLEWDSIEDSKVNYIKTLKEINILDDKLLRQIEKFFKDFKIMYDDYHKESSESEQHKLSISYAWQYSEFLKIVKIAELAKKIEEKKEKAREPIITFKNVINEFLQSNQPEKQIDINKNGELVFSVKGRFLSLSDLSSGEKQILITFASLIFGLKDTHHGIFIVDEPEASLHLEWQSKFVSSILKLNQNVQYIFATHSPELIGRYRDYAVKLDRIAI